MILTNFRTTFTGSDDIRAHETHKWDRRPFAHLFEDHEIPHHRILVPGYRYLPVHRETYGYSPRQIYPHHYTYGEKLRPGNVIKYLSFQVLMWCLKTKKKWENEKKITNKNINICVHLSLLLLCVHVEICSAPNLSKPTLKRGASRLQLMEVEDGTTKRWISAYVSRVFSCK